MCLALGSKLLLISLIGFLLLWLSKMKITSHVWFPTSERLAMIHKCVCIDRCASLCLHAFVRTSRLFVLPFYESAIVEQNLILNKQEKDDMQMNGKQT
jgi:hypothetical protein